MALENIPPLSEEEINGYSKELDQLFQSILFLLNTPSEPIKPEEEHY